MTTTPKITTTRSEEVVRKHKEFIWPAVTNYYQHPLVADHASMQYLWDIEGNKYLDFFGGIVTIGVGHCNPKVTSKIKAQVDKLQHTSTLFPNEAVVALAEKLAEITPGKLQKSFFTSSGTEANEAAIMLARMASPSYDIVALRHAYSGGSALAKSVTAQSAWRKGGVISVGVSHAVNPYCYRCPLHLTYPSCNVACANDVESVIQTTTSGSIAAFIAEPIQGVGGIHHSSAGIFQDRVSHREELRRPVYFRRSADGLGSHRQEMVGHRTMGSDAGHYYVGEEHGAMASQWD